MVGVMGSLNEWFCMYGGCTRVGIGWCIEVNLYCVVL